MPGETVLCRTESASRARPRPVVMPHEYNPEMCWKGKKQQQHGLPVLRNTVSEHARQQRRGYVRYLVVYLSQYDILTAHCGQR